MPRKKVIPKKKKKNAFKNNPYWVCPPQTTHCSIQIIYLSLKFNNFHLKQII